MKRHYGQVALLVLIGFAMTPMLAAAANRQRIECPMYIPEKDMAIPSAPAGWKALVSGPAHINRVELTMGAPELRVVLKPQRLPKNGKWLGDQWAGLKASRQPDEDGVWMSCVYGSSGNFALSRRLDDNVEQCKAIYRLDTHGHNQSIEIMCTW